MHHIFQRAPQDSGDMQPCTWRPVPSGVWKKADVCCPDCGQTFLLKHHIEPDGKVSPHIVCPGSHCEFHAFGVPEGWES